MNEQRIRNHAPSSQRFGLRSKSRSTVTTDQLVNNSNGYHFAEDSLERKPSEEQQNSPQVEDSTSMDSAEPPVKLISECTDMKNEKCHGIAEEMDVDSKSAGKDSEMDSENGDVEKNESQLSGGGATDNNHETENNVRVLESDSPKQPATDCNTDREDSKPSPDCNTDREDSKPSPDCNTDREEDEVDDTGNKCDLKMSTDSPIEHHSKLENDVLLDNISSDVPENDGSYVPENNVSDVSENIGSDVPENNSGGVLESNGGEFTESKSDIIIESNVDNTFERNGDVLESKGDDDHDKTPKMSMVSSTIKDFKTTNGTQLVRDSVNSKKSLNKSEHVFEAHPTEPVSKDALLLNVSEIEIPVPLSCQEKDKLSNINDAVNEKEGSAGNLDLEEMNQKSKSDLERNVALPVEASAVVSGSDSDSGSVAAVFPKQTLEEIAPQVQPTEQPPSDVYLNVEPLAGDKGNAMDATGEPSVISRPTASRSGRYLTTDPQPGGKYLTTERVSLRDVTPGTGILFVGTDKSISFRTRPRDDDRWSTSAANVSSSTGTPIPSTGGAIPVAGGIQARRPIRDLSPFTPKQTSRVKEELPQSEPPKSKFPELKFKDNTLVRHRTSHALPSEMEEVSVKQQPPLRKRKLEPAAETPEKRSKSDEGSSFISIITKPLRYFWNRTKSVPSTPELQAEAEPEVSDTSDVEAMDVEEEQEVESTPTDDPIPVPVPVESDPVDKTEDTEPDVQADDDNDEDDDDLGEVQHSGAIPCSSSKEGFTLSPEEGIVARLDDVRASRKSRCIIM